MRGKRKSDIARSDPIRAPDWLKDSLKEIINPEKIFYSEVLDETTTPVIKVAEIELFKGYM